MKIVFNYLAVKIKYYAICLEIRKVLFSKLTELANYWSMYKKKYTFFSSDSKYLYNSLMLIILKKHENM